MDVRWSNDRARCGFYRMRNGKGPSMGTAGTDRSAEADHALSARIDATGWGLFFLWVGVALGADLGWGIGLLGTGLISLGGQLARSLSGVVVDRWSVGFGVCLSLAGLLQWLDLQMGRTPWPAWALPVAIAALGVVILASTWMRRH